MSGKKRKIKANGSKQLDINGMKLPSHEQVKKEVVSKVGKMPKRPKSLPEGDWTEQSLRVLKERYLIKNSEAEVVETPEDMCWRVAWEMASAEARWGAGRREVKKIAKEYYKLLVSHRFLPNSPTLMNAGTGNKLQYSGCYVLPIDDSLVGIFDAIKYQALIHQTGGGTGFAFSRLRPRGSMVKSSTGTASGPVSFMRIFDSATNEIKQGGKRRGANMGILRIDHPDIFEFIHCKEDGGITNFNISVAVTDKFMRAYKNDGEYELINPKTKEVTGKLKAREVFAEIAQGAWRTGDPGLVFVDRLNTGSSNPVPSLGPIESTNPCGEQPLYPWDSCNLGSIFLTYFVKGEGKKKTVDWKLLKSVTRTAIRFMDSVIEMNPYPLDEVRELTLAIRRIGLGVGGWADMLLQLGIPYDSEKALNLGEKVMKVIQEEAVAETKRLAKDRGPFPMWPVSIYAEGEPRRNSTVTTIAPTGSISIIAGASSGIEPLFAVAYQHIVKDKHLDRTLSFINPYFEKVAKQRGFWSESLEAKIAESGVVRDIDVIPEDVRKIFGTAHEIHHDWHIKHQAAFQKYTENAVSKTINMSNSVTEEDIGDAYLLAWETNCKGITVFRDGCKDAQVLNLGVKDKKEETVEEKIEIDGEPLIERPYLARGATYRITTPLGTAFITINEDEKGQPLELFINIGKAGSDVNAMAAALGRTISAALRFKGGLSPRERAREIISQLSGIAGRRSIGFGPNKVLSLPDAVASAFTTHFKIQMNGNYNTTDVTSNHNHTNGNHNETGVQSDSAGAVMLAQSSDLVSDIPNGINDDHTAASAESHLTPDGLAVSSLDSDGNVQTILNGHDDGITSKQLSLTTPRVAGDICPSCGASALVFEEGCSKCHVCGHSEC